MGPCPGDLHLCWASKLLGLITLLSACSTSHRRSGAHGSGMKDSRTHTLLHRIQGGSVLFSVIKESGVDLEPEIERISWKFGPESEYRVLLEFQRGADAPTWISLQDKYKLRVCVPRMTSLMIENLTTQDSGQYTAEVRLKEGKGMQQGFYLAVYEPVPPAQIWPKSLSITPDWCNMTLECRAPRAPEEELNVSWESEGLPGELQQRRTPGPAPNPWTLAVRLSPGPPNARLTCVLSNQVDQRNATSDLGDICGQVRGTDSHGWHLASLKGYMPGVGLGLLLVLGAGLYLWMIREKKKKEEEEEEENEEENEEEKMMEMGTGAGWPEDHTVDHDGVHYVQLMEACSREDQHEGTDEQHRKKKEPLSVIYCEVHTSSQAVTAF